jgi:TonB family protein
MTVNEVKRKLVVCLLALSAVVTIGSLIVLAQSGDSSDVKRKVKSMGRPGYPELARKLNLTGAVKVEVTIGTDGKVKRTRVLGGHPVLATEAEKAAQQSEFEPGPKETVEIIEFKFSPQ